MKDTFDHLLWEAVQAYRNQTMVVDNHHAYGIIRDRVDSFWEQVRMLQSDDNQENILGGLLGIAMACQLAAENLSLTTEQAGVDESADRAEEAAKTAKDMCSTLFNTIEIQKRSMPALQRGIPRFAFEFDEGWLNVWKQRLEEMG